MMKKFNLSKATDLYDCGTATFRIAGERGNNHIFYGDLPLKD
jgi:hypothetical protein